MKQANPDRDFSADPTEEEEFGVGTPKGTRVPSLFDDPLIQQRIAELISSAMRRSLRPGH